MRRRSKASSKPTKAQSRKAKAPNAVRHNSTSASDQQTEVVRLRRELDEAREQQAATADVLKVISRSRFDLRVVLDTLVESAARLSEADTGLIRRREGDTYLVAATFGVSAQQREHFESYPTKPDRGSAFGRAILKSQTVHIPDVLADAEFDRPQLQSVGRFRAVLAAPLMREGVPIGALGLMRSEPRPFTDEQIALVQNFAAQAVIAIENTRLLSELRQSLERQTATADILRVIASTPEDSKRALDTIAETASRMFDAANVNFRRLEGDILRVVGSAGPSVVRIRASLPDLPLEPTDPAVRSLLDNKQIAFEDRRDSLPNERGEIARALRNLPVRSQAFTPLSRESKAIGVMIVSRSEVRAFDQDELELMKGFADQAVIAIENARLLNELRQRTEEVVKLNQQLEQRVTDQVGEIERMSRLRRFLPPQVADL